MLKRGDKVKMSDDLKRRLRGKCTSDRHEGLYQGKIDLKMPNKGCMSCSTEHVEEFGSCNGIVGGFTYRDTTQFVDVWWQPSGLKYAYDQRDLVLL